MFYNRNFNLKKWFVSPYLTILKETSIFKKKKSKRQEDGHDNEKNFN